jgi:hypothetical protein
VWTDDGAVDGAAMEDDRLVDGAVDVRVEGPAKEDWLVDGAADVLMGKDWPVKEDWAVKFRVEGPSKEDWSSDCAVDVLMGYDWPVKVRVEGPAKEDWLVDGTVENRVECPAKDDAIGVRVELGGSGDGAVDGLVVSYGTVEITDGGAVMA